MNHRLIASAMCQITDELLWQPRIQWARHHNRTADLDFRVGRGRKTYLSHRRDAVNNARMTITYGVEMVRSKADPAQLCSWLSSQEIIDRKYYGGELNLLNSLAHVICHEFGHFVQVILGRRYDGSVHNKEFYEILDRIHAKGQAEQIRAALHNKCMSFGYDLRLIIAPSEKALSADQKDRLIRSLRIGDLVESTTDKNRQFNPFKIVEKRRKKIVIESISHPHRRLIGEPHIFNIVPS